MNKSKLKTRFDTPISNFPIFDYLSKTSNYVTIDDLLYDKYYKKDNIEIDNNITGVKSYHTKYFDKYYDKNSKNLQVGGNLDKIRDNITICEKDYAKQIKNILNNQNIVQQIPGYSKNNLIHDTRNIVTKKEYLDIKNQRIKYNSRYNRYIPLPVSSDFLN